ncbi:MAG: hypothetical protein HN576_08870 [Bacteriovoracaceae bacterium]|nr:hypothetical protein [Bacteriovoracaceae bacterium]
MSLDIESQYNQTIEKLKNGLRPLKLYSTKEGQLLKDKLDYLADSRPINETELKQVLCLLEHGQCHGIDFSQALLKILQLELSTDVMIFTLSTSIKWVVEFNQKNGHPITFNFMNIINALLLNCSEPEVREWVLRLVDSTGNQSLKFKQSLLTIKPLLKPKLFKKTNPHNKNSYKIVLELEKRWEELLRSFK